GLDGLVAPRARARDAERLEGRFRAGVGQQHALDTVDRLDDAFGEFDLLRGDAEPGVVDLLDRPDDGGVDVGVVVPEDRRAVRPVEVDQLAAVGGRHPRSLRGDDDDVFEAREPALPAVHAAGDDLARALGCVGAHRGPPSAVRDCGMYATQSISTWMKEKWFPTVVRAGQG